MGGGKARTNEYDGKEIGKFKVCCFGKAVIPNDWCSSLWSWLLILVPSTLQIVLVNQSFSNRVMVILI